MPWVRALVPIDVASRCGVTESFVGWGLVQDGRVVATIVRQGPGWRAVVYRFDDEGDEPIVLPWRSTLKPAMKQAELVIRGQRNPA